MIKEQRPDPANAIHPNATNIGFLCDRCVIEFSFFSTAQTIASGQHGKIASQLDVNSLIIAQTGNPSVHPKLLRHYEGGLSTEATDASTLPIPSTSCLSVNIRPSSDGKPCRRRRRKGGGEDQSALTRVKTIGNETYGMWVFTDRELTTLEQ